MGRSPGDGGGIVALHLIKKGVDAGDDLLVGNRFDGAGCEQFDAVETIGDKIRRGEEAGSRDLRRFRIEFRAW